MTSKRVLPGGWTAAGLALLLAATTACHAAPRTRPLPVGDVASGPGSLAQARKFLEGRWILESFEVRPPGRALTTLKGSGVLNYDDFGNLTMDIRADEASSDLMREAGIDIRDGVISTSGQTVIDLQHRTLTYVLEGQSSSYVTGGGPLAPSRPRHWDVTADTLTLTTRDDTGAALAVSRWKRSS